MVAANAELRREAMVADWHESFAAGEDAVMVAKRNVEVEGLNEMARQMRREADELGANSTCATVCRTSRKPRSATVVPWIAASNGRGPAKCEAEAREKPIECGPARSWRRPSGFKDLGHTFGRDTGRSAKHAREQAQQRLRESQRELERIKEAAPDSRHGLLVRDRQVGPRLTGRSSDL